MFHCALVPPQNLVMTIVYLFLFLFYYANNQVV
jgi:hypothetical protein